MSNYQLCYHRCANHSITWKREEAVSSQLTSEVAFFRTYHATFIFYEKYIDKHGDAHFPFVRFFSSESSVYLSLTRHLIKQKIEKYNKQVTTTDDDDHDRDNDDHDKQPRTDHHQSAESSSSSVTSLSLSSSETMMMLTTPRNVVLPKLDIHTAGDLLKSFLRKLPHPIIPRSPYFAHFIQFSAMSKEEIRIAAYAAMIRALPENSYHLLKYLCSFFHMIELNKEKTLMNASNLGVIFAPCFFGSMDKDPDIDISTIDHISMCKESKYTAEITADIIHHQSSIFNVCFSPLP